MSVGVVTALGAILCMALIAVLAAIIAAVAVSSFESRREVEAGDE